MMNLGSLKCTSCAVPEAAKEITGFCSKCHNQFLQRDYCIALLEPDGTLIPFIGLDDASQASIYAERLRQRDVPHVMLKWNAQEENFTPFKAVSLGLAPG